MTREHVAPQRTGRRRGRSPHPGVILVPPGPGREDRGWQARWRDPDRGNKTTAISLGPCGLSLRTHEQRTTWAIAKSRTLKARLAAIESGDLAAAGLPIREAVDELLAVKRNAGKARSAADLTSLIKPFVAWCADQPGMKTTADIHGPDVFRYRDFVLGMRKTKARRNPKKGLHVGRGARAATDDLLAPGTRNGYLAAAMRFLNWARQRGHVRVSRDTISDALRGEHVEAKRIVLNEPDTIRGLLTAAIQRDVVRRESVAGPFALLLLMTGARVGEIQGLRWDEVNLDGDGAIDLPAYRTKTNRTRIVDFDICPTAKALLIALRGRARKSGTQPGAESLVFEGVNTREIHEDLLTTYGAPPFEWKYCRATSGSFLACAPGLKFTTFTIALRLGHGTDVCEKHYLNKVRNIPAHARTLESAMGIGAQCRRIVALVRGDQTALSASSKRASVVA